MTQEQKDLLVKDLCARLPYGVKITVNDRVETLEGISVLDTTVEYDSFLSSDIEEVKPYLFPMSSMTKEQQEEYDYECNKDLKALSHSVANRTYAKTRIATPLYYGIDWLNKNHFDYRGLIPMGLAEDATGLNIY